jgi:hypothetical protein
MVGTMRVRVPPAALIGKENHMEKSPGYLVGDADQEQRMLRHLAGAQAKAAVTHILAGQLSQAEKALRDALLLVEQAIELEGED